MVKKCFLCGSKESVIDFEDEIFKNCLLKLSFRKERGFKYGNIQLSKDSLDFIGYHSTCYSKVTVLKNKYKEDFDKFVIDHDMLSIASTTDKQQKGLDSSAHSSSKAAEDVEDDTEEILMLEDSDVVPSTSAPPIPDAQVTCIFCNCKQKRSGKRLINLTMNPSDESLKKIKDKAISLDDDDISSKLENKHIVYHRPCYATFLRNEQKTLEENPSSSWHTYRYIHKQALDSLINFISREIIDNNRVMYFAQLFIRYQALLLEFGKDTLDMADIEDYRAEMLERKLLTKLGDKITIEASTGPRHLKIVYKTDIDVSVMANNTKSLETENEKKFDDVSFHLRNCIKKLDHKPLPKRLRVEDVVRGECEIPKLLFDFMCNLIKGPHFSSEDSNQMTTQITSICSDIIYAVSKGLYKPAKNLTLGLAVKSLTNSRQVITILNKYGHTISYNLAEELETEMTYTSVEDNNVVPTGIKATNECSTHVAFDNFDRFVDTTSGKDTMHDTVGIIYQFPSLLTENPTMEAMTSSTPLPDDNQDEEEPSRKRRRFSGISRVVQPHYSKPTASMQLLTVNSFTDAIEVCEGATEIAKSKDILWVMSLLRKDLVPMWLGYNCIMSADQSEIQKIEYLPPINSSPTSYAVVKETLNMANEIAIKCNQENIIVTYDLAIAKMAMQIQEQDKPKFDHIFINLGAFHMQMAFFKAIGKYIDSCGLVDVLVQSEVLAGGSANSFLDSKHFNRCKRLHPLTASALETLHFEQYLSTTNISPEMLDDLLKTLEENTLCNESTSNVHDAIELPDVLNRVINGYKEFCKQTLTGEKGKTAQYYYQYCELINLFLRFSRSIRTSNFELYIDSIFNICDFFFALNQPNYARWSLLYLSNILRLRFDNSPLIAEFRRGAFGIRRTAANFSRTPVDLTLEQTINADASNELKNNLAVESISARQRWALNHSMRTKILTTLKENVGLSKKDDTLHCLQKNKIAKDNKSFQSIVEAIKNNMNPFDENIDKNVLFNISTGKAASGNVAEFLINIKKIGHQQKLNFIEECNSVSGRFEKPIQRNKILNFASECATKLLTKKDTSKKVLLKMERDIFGRLLAVSIQKKINIEYCLTFPLAPMPPALFSCDGGMFKTDKSALAKLLKSDTQIIQPTQINVEIIDGFYYLYQIGASMPQTFDKIAESILIKLCSTNAAEIHLVFDRYISPSIKDLERQSRQEFDITFNVSGPQQTRPSDFLKSLKNYRFKEALVHFLSNYWENDSLATIIQNKKVFLTVEQNCYSYQTQHNRVIKTEEIGYLCEHEEADTRMIFHASRVTPGSKILIKSSDTDVLIILLGNIDKLQQSEIWLASSTKKKINTQDLDCINCTNLAQKLGTKLCQSLPAFHAFTGCDYTAAFYQKGKVRPFKLLSKNQTYQDVFASLLDEADIFLKNKMKIVEEFTVSMYGIKQCTSVNDARYRIFEKSYSAKEDNEQFLKKVKSFNSNVIPPCWSSLTQKILRTIYINSMWRHATDPDCIKLRPEDCGWILEDNVLKPVGFVGDQTPLKIDDIIEVTNDKNEELSELEDHFTASDDSDTE